MKAAKSARGFRTQHAAALVLACAVAAGAQVAMPATQSSADHAVPVLHTRADPERPDPNAIYINTRRHSSTSLPEDASGEYAFGRPGEVVEIDLQSGQLTGYISRFGAAESDRETLLTYFFERVSVAGETMRFTTRQVHGVWFSFEGTVVRGTTNDPTREGYYLLEGNLIEHNAVARTTQRRGVSLHMLGGHD